MRRRSNRRPPGSPPEPPSLELLAAIGVDPAKVKRDQAREAVLAREVVEARDDQDQARLAALLGEMERSRLYLIAGYQTSEDWVAARLGTRRRDTFRLLNLARTPLPAALTASTSPRVLELLNGLLKRQEQKPTPELAKLLVEVRGQPRRLTALSVRDAEAALGTRDPVQLPSPGQWSDLAAVEELLKQLGLPLPLTPVATTRGLEAQTQLQTTHLAQLRQLLELVVRAAPALLAHLPAGTPEWLRDALSAQAGTTSPVRKPRGR